MDRQAERVERLVRDCPRSDWHRLADAMAWVEANSDPPGMNPRKRALFWYEVKRGRSLATAIADLKVAMARWAVRASHVLHWHAGPVRGCPECQRIVDQVVAETVRDMKRR